MEQIAFEQIPLTQIPARVLACSSGPSNPVVLVVDDERIIADTLGAILEMNGYAALVAYDGPTALELARLIPPDLLISDVVMPGMSGVELAMTLLQSLAECKVLLFSGQAATLDLLAAARSAGHNFIALSKPMHPTAMLAQVANMVPQYTGRYVA